jgi:serine/threonine protein kinase
MKEDGPLKIGSRFLKYEVKALLGRGGHAWVYHGFDAFMGRNVAIKIVHRSGGVTRDMLRRGQAEAQFLSRLKHPNIVEVIDAGMTDEGLLYIVMELLQGRSLYDIVREEKRLEPQEALTVFAAIADALQAAHDAGAIHRDLKPGNVYVVKDNRPKVLDFGIAKIVDAAWTTQQDVVLGTVFYMSPEQLQARNLTRHTDIYSLGVMLYEVLSGVHYIRRAAAAKGVSLQNIYSVIPFVVHEDVTPLHQIDPSIPPHIGRIVDRCMAKSPDQRFDSMRDVAAALRHSLERFLGEAQAEGRPSHCRDLSRPSLPVHASEARLPPPPEHASAPPPTARTVTEAFTHDPFLGTASAVQSARPGTAPLQVQLITAPLAPVLHPAAPALGPLPNASTSVAEAPAPAGSQVPGPAHSSRLKETLPLGSGESPIRSAPPAPIAHREALTAKAGGSSAWTERVITPSSVSAHVSSPLDSGSRAPARGNLKTALIIAGVTGPLLFGGATFLALKLTKKPEPVAGAAPTGVVIESVDHPAPSLVPPPPPPPEVVAEPEERKAPPPPSEPQPAPKTGGKKPVFAPRPPAPVASATTSARPAKDKMEERLEMLERDLEEQGAKKKLP